MLSRTVLISHVIKGEQLMKKYTEKEAQCFLQSINFINTKKLNKLKAHFGSCLHIINSPEAEFNGLLTPDEAKALTDMCKTNDISSTLNELKANNISYYPLFDPDYPEALRHIPSPPLAIYVKGRLPDPFLPKVAIIGARNCSAYGSQMARLYAKELTSNSIQIISGMARGVDGIAELSALNSGGYTCSVLGCGIDICYPKENQLIYDMSLKQGGIISEYPPGTPPHPRLFPPRNRIISGLSDAIIVIEARERSGTLITVNMALDQGRDIYALPGRTTDSLSYGCNMLIKDGATPLITPKIFLDEFLDRFNLQRNNSETKSIKHSSVFLSADERLIMSVLDFIPQSISEIYCHLNDKTSMSIPTLMQLLTNMTLQHKIKCIDGNNYYIEED